MVVVVVGVEGGGRGGKPRTHLSERRWLPIFTKSEEDACQRLVKLRDGVTSCPEINNIKHPLATGAATLARRGEDKHDGRAWQ